MSESTESKKPRVTLKALEEQLETVSAEKIDLESKVEKLGEDLKASQELATETQGKLDTLQSEHEALTTEATEAKATITALEGERDTLKAANAALEAKEQDIDKRATALFAAKQAAIGESGPLATGTPAGGEKPESASKNLTGYERALASLKEKNAANSQ